MSAEPRINKLKAAMQGMAGPMATTIEAAVAAPAPVLAPKPTRATPLPPSRQGKRSLSAYIAAAAAKQLRLMAAEQDTSTQALVEEALNDLFRKYNRSAVA